VDLRDARVEIDRLAGLVSAGDALTVADAIDGMNRDDLEMLTMAALLDVAGGRRRNDA